VVRSVGGGQLSVVSCQLAKQNGTGSIVFGTKLAVGIVARRNSCWSTRCSALFTARPPRCFSNGWCMNTDARVEYDQQTNRVSENNSGPDNLSTVVAIASARRTRRFAKSRRAILVSRRAPRTRTRRAVAPNHRSQRIATALASTRLNTPTWRDNGKSSIGGLAS
jgi:hypothetical protein